MKMNFLKLFLSTFFAIGLLFFSENNFAQESVKEVGEKKEEVIEKPIKKKIKKVTVDRIITRVNGANILLSDLNRPQIANNGMPFSLDDLIDYELYYQKSGERKLLPTNADVEKQITALKIQNGLDTLSEAEFADELKKEGFTLQDYKMQMGKMLAVEKLKHAEFSERIVVTSQEVEDYFKKNPEWDEEKYNLSICSVSSKYVDENGKLIQNAEQKFNWNNLGWVERKDLSDRLAFVSTMEDGQISDPIKSGDDYQLVKLVKRSERQLKNLASRYSQIEAVLQRNRREKFHTEFSKELRDKASIVYLT